MTDQKRPFLPLSKPEIAGDELKYIQDVLKNGKLAGDGAFTQHCHSWIEENTGCHKALLTHSCTEALEMSALLMNLSPGDEIIMPSYTFVSTANAFVLRGAIPVFVDIRPDTLNLDETLIEAAISPRTKAIVPVHYAGVGCEMDVILEIARKYNLMVIEDAAQGLGACYKGKALGSIGDLGTFSFHETKNIISGEGGALLINSQQDALAMRAEIIREKGTNRSLFMRGEVDKYTWQEVGSSYLPSELIAAFLWAQLQDSEIINTKRRRIWQNYNDALGGFGGKLQRMHVPEHCGHNAHMYYVLFPNQEICAHVRRAFLDNGIQPAFHYVPLHSSPAGTQFGVTSGDLAVTNDVWSRLLRLPLYPSLGAMEQEKIIDTLLGAASDK